MLGQNFLDLLERAPPPLRQILLDEHDGSTRIELEGRRETVQVLRRRLTLGGHEHVALVLNLVTQMLGQQESQVLAKVIRVISHELNNSLASMASLLHSGRIITERAQAEDKLSRVFHGLEGRVTHLRGFLGEYAALARLPRPRRAAVDWPAFLSRVSAGFPDCQFS